MSGYSQGVRVEHLVIHHLTAQGFECQRAASSKGVADVIGLRAGLVALVNCKRTTMPGPAERVALLRVAACLPSVALPLVALKPARKPLEFRLLTGPGPKDWQTWEPEHDQGDDLDTGETDDPWDPVFALQPKSTRRYVMRPTAEANDDPWSA